MIKNKDGYITTHFKQSELNHSNYASNNNLVNIASGFQKQNQMWLAIVLEVIREEMQLPISITSGFRSPEVNSRVGGSKTSAHMSGSAADIYVHGSVKTVDGQKAVAMKIAKILHDKGVVFDQLIYYKSWVHVGMNFTTLGRRQIFQGSS